VSAAVSARLGGAYAGVDVSWEAARAVAHTAGRVRPAQRLPLTDAVGATLAEPLVALADLPSADRSAMDGYAVRGAPPWTVVGELRAGDAPAPLLLPGSAAAIATGAPVPPGADAVIPVERSTSDGPTVRPLDRVRPGAHIRRRGEECRDGDVLVPSGRVVTPQIAGLAAALGHDTLAVLPAPRTAALVTGDELRTSGAPGPGQVRDAIGPMLPGLISWAGGTPVGVVLVPDSRERLTGALAAADADVVLVSGSSSVGPVDHLRPCLAELGADVLVDGVACRPGHPQSLALLPDGRAVVGLPGNPLAALAAFLTLAVPLLVGRAGRPLAPLDRATPNGLTAYPRSTRLVPVRLVGGAATAVPYAGSAMLRGVALADAIAVVPPGYEPPAPVQLLPLPSR
jgi:molybdopterin molybdotransferase